MTHPLTPAEMRIVAKELHVEARKYAAPIWWGTNLYDASSVLHNATCFLVDTGSRCFGVTANHVITEFKLQREQTNPLHLMIRNVDITDWDTRVIDTDTRLDIATFEVSKEEQSAIGTAVSTSQDMRWPPARGEVGKGAVLVGYPEVDREVPHKSELVLVQVTNLVTLTDHEGDYEYMEFQVQPSSFVVTDDHVAPPTTKNLSGLSGGPILVVADMPHRLFWIGGIIVRQTYPPKESQPTVIWGRSIRCLNEDGTINRLKRPWEE